MVMFFDTSALLKRYRQEDGTMQVEKLLDRANQVVLSQTARSEAVSALNFHVLRGTFTKAHCQKAQAELEADFQDFRIIPLDAGVEHLVTKVAEKYGHKALDNIQLASALVAKPTYFVTADKKLARLAKSEKLKVKLV
jgi:predicted nucleic acid-binding protein